MTQVPTEKHCRDTLLILQKVTAVPTLLYSLENGLTLTVRQEQRFVGLVTGY